MTGTSRSRVWAAVLVGEVLEAVYDSHQGQPEEQVRDALCQEYERRGLGALTAESPRVTGPAAQIAAGRRPVVPDDWFDPG